MHNGLAWVKKDGKWGVIELPDAESVSQDATTTQQKNNPQAFTEEQLQTIRSALQVPEDLPVTIKQDEPYYWDAGGRWLTFVNIYYGNEAIAYAAFDSNTVEIIRDIWMYDADNFKQTIVDGINAFLQENWCGENQYYCFEEDLTENNGYLWVCIRWDGSNSANAICGSDIKIDKATGEAEITMLDKVYDQFNLFDYT